MVETRTARKEESGVQQLNLIGQYGNGFTLILLHHSSPLERKYESGKSYNSEHDLPIRDMIYLKAENWQDIKDILNQ